MHKHSIHISVNEPCSKNWEEMTDAEEGRYCNACEKVVTDFTLMSDEQLIDFFAKRAEGENPCGHFRKNQLDKTIALPQPPKKFKILKLAVSFLMAQALFYQEKAFGKLSPPIEIVSTAAATNEESIIISGRLIDYHSDNPISGVKVYIDKTDLYSITDKNGKFTIQISDTVQDEITILTAYADSKSYVAGSVILEKKGNIKELSQNEIILYRYPDEEMDELVIVEYNVPLISGGYGLTGAPVHVMHVKKETFWQRITKIFRKK